MLVTVEGIDGAGKTTVVERLADEFDATFTREPTDSWLGENVERALHDGSTEALADLFLFVADHADHLERVVRPALDTGETVVCDRYVDSRCAYQGATLAGDARLNGEDALGWVRSIHEPWTVVPDLTLLLDLSASEAMTRVDGEAKYERADFLADVRENFLRLADEDTGDRFVVVDATRDADEVAERCADELRRLVG